MTIYFFFRLFFLFCVELSLDGWDYNFFRTAQQNIAGEQRNCELNGNEDLIQ